MVQWNSPFGFPSESNANIRIFNGKSKKNHKFYDFFKKTIAPSHPPRGEEKSEEPLARRSQLVVSSEE